MGWATLQALTIWGTQGYRSSENGQDRVGSGSQNGNREAFCRGRTLVMLCLLHHLPSRLGPDSCLPSAPQSTSCYSLPILLQKCPCLPSLNLLIRTFLSLPSVPSPEAPAQIRASHALPQVGHVHMPQMASKSSLGCWLNHLSPVQLLLPTQLLLRRSQRHAQG